MLCARACISVCANPPQTPTLPHLSHVNLLKPIDRFSRDTNCILLTAKQMYSNFVLSNSNTSKALTCELGATLSPHPANVENMASS